MTVIKATQLVGHAVQTLNTLPVADDPEAVLVFSTDDPNIKVIVPKAIIASKE